jgi:ribose transport system permease protein
VVGILTGTTLGITNGLLISRMKIPPFIATLGTMMIARGLALVLATIETGTVKPIYFDETPIFRQITMSSILSPLLAPVVPGFNLPNAVLILFIAALIAAFILAKTVLGRYAVAMGSNEEATRLSGVNVANWKTAVYALGGTFSGLAGVMMASRLNSAQPALGVGYELEAIAAVVIGGTSLSGGEGTILGTIIGAFIISTLTNGLRIMNVPQEWQFVVTGLIVILAVYLDILRRRRS